MRGIARVLIACAAGLAAGCHKADLSPAEPLSVPVRESAWDSPTGDGRELQTAHYRLFTTARSSELRSLLPGFLEACRRNYLRTLNLPDEPNGEPMSVYVLGSREEWASLTTSVLGERAETYLRIQSGGYCYRDVCVLWEIGGLGTLQVAAHEGMHQFLHQRLKDQLPMWLEEALCTQAEGYQVEGQSARFGTELNTARNVDLQQAIVRGLWVPAERLVAMDASDAIGPGLESGTAYYGQLWALVRFLRSDPAYSLGLDRLLRDAEAGRLNQALGFSPQQMRELRQQGRAYNQQVGPRLFRHYISQDPRAFDKRFKEFAIHLAKLG